MIIHTAKSVKRIAAARALKGRKRDGGYDALQPVAGAEGKEAVTT